MSDDEDQNDIDSAAGSYLATDETRIKHRWMAHFDHLQKA